MGTLFEDVRYGLRLLAKKPSFTAVAMLTLTLGIGANTAVFSIVDAVLLRPLPYKDSNRLVAVWESEIRHLGSSRIFASFRDFEAWKRDSHSFEELEACTWARAGQTLTWHGAAQRVLAIPVTEGFFSLLGAHAAEGRTFEAQDLKNGCTIVLGHRFWQSRLGSASDIVGRSLTLDDKGCTVVGIAPKGFEFYPKQTDLWTLITSESEYAKHPLDSAVGVFGRLKPGVSRASALAELSVLHRRVVNEAPAGSWVREIVPVVYDLQEAFTWMAGRNLRTALLVLLAAVVFVLLIACVNVANLLLGRASERQKEFAIRAALGSGRSRLIRQLLTESTLLAILGAVFGICLAVGGIRYFRAVVELPPGNSVTVNLHVLAFTVFVAILTGLLFGLVPAWKASRLDLNEVLKETSQGVRRGALSHRVGRLLVIAEVTLSLILLAGAGLLIESIARLGSAQLGFRADHLLTARVSLPEPAYSKLGRRTTFYEKLTSNLGALPGVEGVAVSSSLPLYGTGEDVLTVQGKPAPVSVLGDVGTEEVSADYFRVMRVPILRGREFDSRDRAESQAVAVVNEALVREYFPDQDPIGRQIRLGTPDDKNPWLTIVGVVENVKRTTVYVEMGYAVAPRVFRPATQAVDNSMEIVIRAAGDSLNLAPAVQREVTALDANVPTYDVRTMNDRVSEFLSHPRFRAVVLGVFAGLALLLAAIGIYGVLSQAVVQRTHEIGIRMALGAEGRDVLRLVVGQGMSLASVGVGLGLVAALAVTRFLASMLYGVKPTDALTFGVASLVLTGVALIACYIPARRATKVDPMVALRHE